MRKVYIYGVAYKGWMEDTPIVLDITFWDDSNHLNDLKAYKEYFNGYSVHVAETPEGIR